MKTEFDRLLLIDDDPIVAETLEDYANNYNFQIEYYKYLEDGLSELDKNYEKYVGLILDAKGQRNEGSRKDDDSHLSFAVMELTKLEERGKKIPWVIFTGYFDKYSKEYSHLQEKIFDKGRHEKRLIQYFFDIREKSASYRVRNRYSEIFDILDKEILGEDFNNGLLDLLANIEENKCTESCFNDLRKIHEIIIKKIYKQGNLPTYLMKGSYLNIDWTLKYLSGYDIKDSGVTLHSFPSDKKPIFPQHISTISSAIKNITNNFSHDYKKPFTPNALKFAVYGLFEIIHWLDNYLINNK